MEERPPQGGAAAPAGQREEGQEAAAGWGGLRGCWPARTGRLLGNVKSGVSLGKPVRLGRPYSFRLYSSGHRLSSLIHLVSSIFLRPSFSPTPQSSLRLTQQAGTQQRTEELRGSP